MQCWGIEWPDGYTREEVTDTRTYYKWRVAHTNSSFVSFSILRKKKKHIDWRAYLVGIREPGARFDVERWVDTPQEALAFCLFYTGKE